MKLSAVAKAARAERATSFRFHGRDVPALLRAMSALEDTDAVAAAIKACKQKGAEPTSGQPIYDACYAANVLAVACLDPDSPPTAREPLFDKGAEQAMSELDQDTLAMLFEQQQQWQEECSPLVRPNNAGELLEMAKRVAEADDPLVYARLSPRTRWILQRTTAALLVQLQAFKPSSSSLSGVDSESRSDAPPSSATTS